MPTISLSASFFSKELHAYGDWRSAFWRELLQNAVDANASTIQITLRSQGEGCVATFHDDGPGMTRETLEQFLWSAKPRKWAGPQSVDLGEPVF